MINTGNNNVEKNQIAVVIDDLNNNINFEDVKKILKKPSKKRDWFDPGFYRCLPLTIANQYGISVVNQYDFEVFWNGGNRPEDLKITVFLEDGDIKYPRVNSVFGYGVITFGFPFHIKTAPGVNIMTINPPNTILNNITVLSGVVETDNLRHAFTVNLKLQFAGMNMLVKKGTEIATILPIPRYFSDSFEILDAEKLFSQEVYNDELEARINHDILRGMNKIGDGQDIPDGLYMRGLDIYNNKFKDHQRP